MKSKLEIKHAYLLDADESIEKWSYEPMVIKTSVGNYHPDFLIEYKDGTKKINEVKCDWSLNRKPENKVKLQEAEEFLKKFGIEFELIIY